MISRWDALPNLLVHGGYVDEPYSIRFRCERCGSTVFYHLEPPYEAREDPVTILRIFILRCTRCGLIEATVARTDILGGRTMTPPAPGPRVLYISGPFSHPDPVHGIPKNILQASEAALVAWRDGWAVHCPHKNCAGFEHAAGIPYETWIQGDLELLRRSDAICMVGTWTESPGALQEYRLARALGMPIYRYVAEEIRLMPATMLPVYDMLTEEASPHAAD